jgi:hypothetical protein
MLRATYMGREASGSVGIGKSGSYLVDLSSADDVWRKLADTPPMPPPSSMPQPSLSSVTLQSLSRASARPPQFNPMETGTGVTMAALQRGGQKALGFVVQQPPPRNSSTISSQHLKVDPPADRTERRLWLVAGSLVGLAACVLGVLGGLTFGLFSFHQTAAVAAAPVAASAPALVAPSGSPSRAASPDTALAAPVVKPSDTRPANSRIKHTHHKSSSKHARHDRR